MSVSNQQEASDIIALTEVLSKEPTSGLNRMALSRKSSVNMSTISKLIKKYPEYFVTLGDQPLYTLNRFSSFKASVELIKEDVSKKLEEARQQEAAIMGGASGVVRMFFNNLRKKN